MPLLVDDSTVKKMINTKPEITAKNLHSKSMESKLGTALQEVKESQISLATTDDERDMISE